MTHKEKMLYLYQAILTVIYQNELNFTPLKLNKVSLENDFEYPLKDQKFPSYVYDIHTGNKNKGVLDFALEGAYIEHEDTTYKNENWRKNYIKFKKLLEGIKESEADVEAEVEVEMEMMLEKSPGPGHVISGEIRGQKFLIC